MFALQQPKLRRIPPCPFKTLVTIYNLDTSDILVNKLVLRRETREYDHIYFSFLNGRELDIDLKLGNYRIVRVNV